MCVVCVRERGSRSWGDRPGILLGFSMQEPAILDLNSLGFSNNADGLLTVGQIQPLQRLKPLGRSRSDPTSHVFSVGRCFLS